jgi:hypothetical protein
MRKLILILAIQFLSQNSFSSSGYTYGVYEYENWKLRPLAKIFAGENNPDTPLEERDKKFKSFLTKVFEFQSYFIINQPIEKFQSAYLMEINRINRIDALNNYRRVSDKDVSNIISDKHYYRDFLHPSAFYALSTVKIPDNTFIKGVIYTYKKAKGADDDEVYDNIKALSEFSYLGEQDIDGEMQDTLRDATPRNFPHRDLDTKAYLLQDMFWIEHFIRFGAVSISFKSLSPNTTMVHLQMALSMNKNFLRERYKIDVEKALIEGINIPFCDICQKGLVNISIETTQKMKAEFSK